MMKLTEIMEALAEHIESLETKCQELEAENAELKENRRKCGQLADMPDVLTAEEIRQYLRISKSAVYGLLRKAPEEGGIPSFGGGKTRKAIRCLKADFTEWLERQRAARSDKTDTVDGMVVDMPKLIKGGKRKKFAV